MKICISPFTYLFYAVFLLFCHDRAFITTITAVLIHETAHLAVIALCGCSIEKVNVTPLGLSIHRTGLTGHLQDIAINSVGPLSNVIFAVFWAISFGVNSLPVAANLFYGLVNLLPIASLDGANVLSSILSLHLSETHRQKLCLWLSNLCLLLLWMLSAAELLMLDGSPSLLFFCIGLFLTEIKHST